MSQPLQTVHVRINDAATGQPTPCRVRFTGPDGTYYAPFGRLTEFATGRNQDVGGNVLVGAKAFAYIDGSCEIALPHGEIGIEVYKGPEYTPLRTKADLPAGKLSLRLAIDRWTNMRAANWYSGDCRCHFLSPHAALLEAMAEDIAVVNLLVTPCEVPNTHGRTASALPSILAFSGQEPSLEKAGYQVVVNTLNSHPTLGTLTLLNCHRVVHPLQFGGPDATDDWTLAAWCNQCHRKGGLVIWAKPGQEGASLSLGEALADTLLGYVDAFEISFYEDSPFDSLPVYYALLNVGMRIPLVGASAKDSNGLLLGNMRTYVKSQNREPLTYKTWIDATRSGHTFVTNGPLLMLTAANCHPGETLRFASESESVSLIASARSLIAFDKLEILLNGEVVAEAPAGNDPATASVRFDLPAATGWLAARCHGAQAVPSRPASQRVFAHTSPIYLECPGRPFRRDAGALTRFDRDLARTLEWVQQQGRFESTRLRDQLVGILQDASRKLTGAG